MTVAPATAWTAADGYVCKEPCKFNTSTCVRFQLSKLNRLFDCIIVVYLSVPVESPVRCDHCIILLFNLLVISYNMYMVASILVGNPNSLQTQSPILLFHGVGVWITMATFTCITRAVPLYELSIRIPVFASPSSRSQCLLVVCQVQLRFFLHVAGCALTGTMSWVKFWWDSSYVNSFWEGHKQDRKTVLFALTVPCTLCGQFL